MVSKVVLTPMSKTALSIAFYLRDGYSKSQAKGNVQVSLKSSGKKAIQNPSGCYTFADLPKGKYIVKIESEYYIYDEIEYEAYTEGAVLGEVFDLIPAPNYPFFSADETLVRGKISDASQNPLAGADIYSSVFTGDLKRRKAPKVDLKYYVASKTDSRGEFVLFFGPIKSEMIRWEDGVNYIKGPDGKLETLIPLLVVHLKQNEISIDHIILESTNSRNLNLAT
jgi:hypothetical protein